MVHFGLLPACVQQCRLLDSHNGPHSHSDEESKLDLWQLYDQSASVINFFTSSFMILSFVFTFPASWLISEKSIKVSIWIGIITTIVGAWMRVFIN